MNEKSPVTREEPLIIYIHGFNSSPQSRKARATLSFCQSFHCVGRNRFCPRLHVPELSHEPELAIAELTSFLETLSATERQHVGLIGSSLGGYYATWLAEQYNLRAVLINPAVKPCELWQDHLGENRNLYSGKIYAITPRHIAQLQRLDCSELRHPENYLLLAQTGDETLDYRQAVEKYGKSPSIIQDGGNHAFEDYETMLPLVLGFLFAGERPVPAAPGRPEMKQPGT